MDKKNLVKKPKYSGLEQLKKLYSRKLSNIEISTLMKKMYHYHSTTFERVKSLRAAGEDEDAYIVLMKYLNLYSYISQTSDYKKDKKYYTAMLGTDFKKAVDLAEIIRHDLDTLYENNIKSNDHDHDQIAAPESTVETLKSKNESYELSEEISSTRLFNILKSNEKTVLIIDTRSVQAFNESHISENFLQDYKSNVINVPDHVIRPGISAQAVETALTEDALPHWKKRASFQMVVVIDWGRTTSGSSFILRKILLEFDRYDYRNGVQVLEGGFEDWMDAYPWSTTNPTRSQPVISEVPQVDLKFVDYDLNFDVEHDIAKPYFNRLTKPSNSVTNTATFIPKFDRSEKLAAIKTYAYYDLLRKKEEATEEAQEVERQRLQREQKLQNELRRQKEQEIDEERQAIIVAEGTKLLIELDTLKEEALKKDSLIQELQKLIEGHEKHSQKASQENEEVAENIKRLEQETEKLKKERDVWEKKQGEERKTLQAAVNLNKESTAFKNNINQISKSVYIPTRPHAPRIDRTTKPNQVDITDPIIGISPGLTGLKNLGNTCYMNSILQCISNNSTLAKYFFEEFYRGDLNRNHKTRGEVAEKVADVVRELWSGHKRSFACNAFKHTVGSIKSEYKTYEQQDSHEFLTFLMDWLHNDLKKEPSSIKESDGKCEMEKAWNNFRIKNESFISTLFYGLQRSTVTCLRCREQSSTYEPFSNLSLIIPDQNQVTLKECLQLYLKRELISGWRCPKCKDEREAEKRTELCKMPSILVIHLKRFSFLEVHSQKRTAFVDFPLENLNIDCVEDQYSYNLYGVSNHYGTMQGGHYTAFCKNKLCKRWYKFDDHEVVELSPNSVKTNAAYILFYNSSKPELSLGPISI